jgi:SAM-dependent methyltransferase
MKAFMQESMQINRAHWDEATDIHARANVYGTEDFKAGLCRLHRVEVDELGDLAGKSLLHLQCHFGLDTLSWARRGAVVTGVDYSPKGIAQARKLARECGIDATFVESNLYDLPQHLTGQFDIVYTSYGVICWLPDIARWGEIIAHCLKPGGTFYIVEAHPFARVFPIDEDIKDGSRELKPMFPYFHDPAGTRWGPGIDYADPSVMRTLPQHTWQHTMADVVNALIRAGLRIEFLHEFPYCPWKVVAFAEEVERFGTCQSYYGLPERFPALPLMFSIKATKPAT